MAGGFEALYTQDFSSTSSITVTHNLDRVICAVRVMIGSLVRNDLVESVVPSPADPRNVIIVTLKASNSGTIQIIDSDYIWGTLPTPEGAAALGNNLSGSTFSGSFSGSFAGDGSALTGITGSGGGTPGGADTYIQFNSGSVFSGSQNLTFDYSANTLSLTGTLDTNGAVLASSFSGDGSAITNAQVSGSNLLWVDISGSDTTGTRGRFDLPYLTIGTAISSASAEDVVLVRPGIYDEEITMADDVSVIGTDRMNCVMQVSASFASGPYVVTMADRCIFANMEIRATNRNGIRFTGTTAGTSTARNVRILATGGTVAPVAISGTPRFNYQPTCDNVDALGSGLTNAFVDTSTGVSFLRNCFGNAFIGFGASGGGTTFIQGCRFVGFRGVNNGAGHTMVVDQSTRWSSLTNAGSITADGFHLLSAAGSNKQIQFNDGLSLLGGDADLTFDNSTSPSNMQLTGSLHVFNQITAHTMNPSFGLGTAGFLSASIYLGQASGLADISAGPEKSLQFNSSSADGSKFSGSQNLTFDYDNNLLELTGTFAVSGSGGGAVEITGTLGVDGNVIANRFDGLFVGDLTGEVTGNVLGNVTGDLVGDVTGDLTGSVLGNVLGNITGDVVGDLTGSVLGTSSFADEAAKVSNALSQGPGIAAFSFDGSSAALVGIDSTVVTLTGAQTLSNKTVSGSFSGSFVGDGSGLTGTRVIVQDSGGTVSGGPHSTLNFVGELSASNSGGGVAQIDVNLPEAKFANYYNASQYTGITTSASTLPFTTTRISSSAFTMDGSGEEVTINTDGSYRVDFGCSSDESSNNDATVDMWIELDTGGGFAEVGGSRARWFHDSSEEEGGNAGFAILELDAGDVIRIRGQVVDGSDQINTLANSLRLSIQTVGANGAAGAAGAQGEQGVTGSGSTIIVEDEGSNIPNTPHSNLNFVGAGVTAADGGSGVATITIPGGGTANIAQYRQTGNLTINTSATTVVLNANDFEDSNYTRSGENITIDTAGIYRISYSIFFDTTANARRTCDGWVEQNTTEIVPSRASGYTRNNTDDTASLSATFLVQLAATDVVRLRCQSTGTNGTAQGVGNRMWITLEFVRAP